MSSLWERVSPSRQAYTHSVADEAPKNRFHAWRDLLLPRFLDIAGEVDREAVQGSITGQVFDGGALAHWSLSPQIVTRTPTMASRLDDEYVFVSIILAGTGGVEINGERTELQPGDFVVVDGTRPFSAYTMSPNCERGFLHLRKSALRQRLGNREDLAIGAYKQGPPLQRLASSFLRDLTGLVAHVDPSMLKTLGDQSLDIIALLASERRPAAVEPSTHQSAMLLRLKLHMKAHLKDASYSVEMAAAALGVTPRYVNSLLALEGTSFGRHLIGSRLEGARRQITDPQYVHRQIIEIAFDWGFNNASHFGKAFKERFGMTPREAKMSGMFNVLGTAA